MLNNLISGAAPMMGAGAAQTGFVNNPISYGTDADGSFDALGYGGAMGGAALGGLGGLLLGKRVSKKAINKLNKDYIASIEDKSERMKAAHSANGKLLKGAGPTAAEAEGAATKAEGLMSKFKGAKGGLKTLLAENPKLAMGGGAALGAMLGSQLLGKALTGQSHANTATQMQQMQALNAQKQQQDLLTIQNASRTTF